ncbi:MAG: P-II family nitrogen regulator [Clostridia bacterium]|nr:P-II family nitrogen regulator [Clostridia bacterium]
MDNKHELILCIVNAGFSDTVMDVAYECGARGGTVIQARGTANKQAEQFFKITIEPEKEMLMLVVPSTIKDKILHALYRQVGLNSPGHGIAFSLPINNVVGLAADGHILDKQEDEKND